MRKFATFVALSIGLLFTGFTTQAQYATYTISAPQVVYGGTAFPVTWQVANAKIRNNDQIWVLNSAGVVIAYWSTKGAFKGTAVFVAPNGTPIGSGQQLTIRYYRTNPWFPKALDASPVAATWVWDSYIF